jgi:hypothetical protein
MRLSSKIGKGLDTYERNTGNKHPSAYDNRLSLRSESGANPLSEQVDGSLWSGTISVGTPPVEYTGACIVYFFHSLHLTSYYIQSTTILVNIFAQTTNSRITNTTQVPRIFSFQDPNAQRTVKGTRSTHQEPARHPKTSVRPSSWVTEMARLFPENSTQTP